ncbi:hypothetical protein [Rheinheimera sp.]|uniref:cold adaptation protein AtcC n=1 Tax=Rheinheimera sp. TaxID=1869214 RepID=UPI00307E504C
MQLVLRNQQGPFLTQVIRLGLAQGQLSTEELEQIKSKAVLMSLKFADKFYNKYKMHLLEQAAFDVIGVASLGLAELAQQQHDKALAVLQSPDGVVKSFQKGWTLLAQATIAQPNRRSLYGDVDEQLLQDLSSPPDAEEWEGLAQYQQARLESLRRNAISVVKQQFYAQSQLDPFEHFSVEDMIAEVVLYRLFTGGDKVRQDLKKRLRQLELKDSWSEPTVLQLQTEQVLLMLPTGYDEAVRAELGANFIDALKRTVEFARKYQKLALEQASPEKLDAFEHKHGLAQPLLGWPQYIEL